MKRPILTKVLSILPWGLGSAALAWLAGNVADIPAVENLGDWLAGWVIGTVLSFVGSWITPEARTKLEEYLRALLNRPAATTPGDGLQ